MREVKINPDTFPARKQTEDWLRSSLYGLTGKCWELSYYSKAGKSQSELIFASCEDGEICFCDGEPETHELLLERIAELRKQGAGAS